MVLVHNQMVRLRAQLMRKREEKLLSQKLLMLNTIFQQLSSKSMLISTWISLSSRHSMLEMSIKLALFPIINHHQKRTQSKEDIPQSFSLQHPKQTNCMKSMRIWYSWLNSITTQSLSKCSLKMQVLVVKKSKPSTKP